MNRGAARQDIFRTVRDAERFLELLGDGCERFGVEVHAYCLMGNHFHLLIHDVEGNLSAYMQRVGSLYTKWHNHRVQRDGPLFRSRFLAPKIEDQGYLVTVARYVHRNPLDVRPRPELDQYRWSSYQYYVGRTAGPEWLCTATLRAQFGSDLEMRAHVEGDLNDVNAAVAIDWIVAASVFDLGDTDIINRSGIARTVATAMLDRVRPSQSAQIAAWLDFPSDSAERSARYRAEKRLAADPTLRQLLAAAVDKAA